MNETLAQAQIIPTGYVSTTEAALVYLARYPDLVTEFSKPEIAAYYGVATANGGWDRRLAAWEHYRRFGNAEKRVWDFPYGPIPPVVTGPITSQSASGARILDGKIFGVDTKLILIGVAAYLILGSKD